MSLPAGGLHFVCCVWDLPARQTSENTIHAPGLHRRASETGLPRPSRAPSRGLFQLHSLPPTQAGGIGSGRGSTRACLLGKTARVKESDTPQVRQLRLVVEAEDFEPAVAFYRDGLGLRVELDLQGDNGEHAMILDAGRATLELSNPAQVTMIDEVEVGPRVAPRLRVAFEVDDAPAAVDRLVDAGAERWLPRPRPRGTPSRPDSRPPPGSRSRSSRRSARSEPVTPRTGR